MPTVIDSLVIMLGLDPSGFRKGQAETAESMKKTREAAGVHTKAMESQAKALAGAFRKVTLEVAGLLGITLSVSGLARVVERITSADAATGRMAANVGVTTKALSAWANLSEKFGGSVADTEASFRNVQKIVQEMQVAGGSSAMGPLGMLLGEEGFSRFVQLAQSGEVEAIMAQLQAAVASATDRTRALHWMQQAGFSDSTFTFMRETGGNFSALLEEQRRKLVTTDRDKDLAIERQQAWVNLTQSLDALAKTILNSDFLNLTAAIRRLTEFLEGLNVNPAKTIKNAARFKDPVDDWLLGNPIRGIVDLVTDPKGVWNNTFGKSSTPAQRRSSGVVTGGSAKEWGPNAFKAGTQEFFDMIRADYGGDAVFDFRGASGKDLGMSRMMELLMNRGAGQASGGSKTDIKIDMTVTPPRGSDAEGIGRAISSSLSDHLNFMAGHANIGVR